MDIHDLVPKNKHDDKNIKALAGLSDDAISPILPELLTWLQDINWPVAGKLLPVLSARGKLLARVICEILRPEETDEVWKYNIISWLLPLFPDEDFAKIEPSVRRIAENPTRGEIREEVRAAASELLSEKKL